MSWTAAQAEIARTCQEQKHRTALTNSYRVVPATCDDCLTQINEQDQKMTNPTRTDEAWAQFTADHTPDSMDLRDLFDRAYHAGEEHALHTHLNQNTAKWGSLLIHLPINIGYESPDYETTDRPMVFALAGKPTVLAHNLSEDLMWLLRQELKVGDVWAETEPHELFTDLTATPDPNDSVGEAHRARWGRLVAAHHRTADSLEVEVRVTRVPGSDVIGIDTHPVKNNMINLIPAQSLTFYITDQLPFGEFWFSVTAAGVNPAKINGTPISGQLISAITAAARPHLKDATDE